MKKIMLILFAIFAIFTLSSSSLCYSRNCDKCDDAVKRKVTGAIRGIAWRDFSVEHKEIDGKKYTTYRCSYGHCYLVNLETGKAKFIEDKENE